MTVRLCSSHIQPPRSALCLISHRGLALGISLISGAENAALGASEGPPGSALTVERLHTGPADCCVRPSLNQMDVFFLHEKEAQGCGSPVSPLKISVMSEGWRTRLAETVTLQSDSLFLLVGWKFEKSFTKSNFAAQMYP